MSETSKLANEVRQAVIELTDNNSESRHDFYRRKIIDINGHDIELRQSKVARSAEDQAKIKQIGARAFATTQWFDDVRFVEAGEREGYDVFEEKSLWLDALYPLDFFVERPRAGMFSGDGRWKDQYLASESFGDTTYYNYVDPKTGVIEHLKAQDPRGATPYNDVFRYYLHQLDEDSSIEHSQSRGYEDENGNTLPITLGRKGLYATFLSHPLQNSISSPSLDTKETASVWLETKKRQYRLHTYEDAPAMVESVKFGSFKDYPEKEASEEFLVEALALLNKAV